MRHRFPLLSIVALVALATILSGGGGSAVARGDGAQGSKEPQVVAVHGVAKVQGQDAIVEILVVVPPGADVKAEAAAALREHGAREISSAEFTTTGLVWDQFLDLDSGNNSVTQYYNPSRAPSGAYDALKRSQTTWTNAPSSFVLSDGGTTTRCPSLVQECPGPQYFDGKNDVGWLRIGSSRTLAVTWYGTSTDEADMAFNTRFQWYTGTGTPLRGQYDVQTVALHENGHVAGLGHSNIDGAVMEPYYEGVRHALRADDIAGLSYLYP